MSSTNWSALRRRYPDQREAIDRLREFLSDARPKDEVTFGRLNDLTGTPDPDALALILGELVKHGELHQVYRVVSRSRQGGIGEFNSLRDVPASIHDWRTDTQQVVEAEDVVPVYKVG